TGLNGEYMAMLAQLAEQTKRPKVILLMGANIGNMLLDEAIHFCKKVRDFMNSGDLFLLGFDLKKNPNTIRAAYNDQEGLTRDFNLNLLKRINRELAGTFDLRSFYHYPCYDPLSGESKSYLMSEKDQVVEFGEGKQKTQIYFQKH